MVIKSYEDYIIQKVWIRFDDSNKEKLECYYRANKKMWFDDDFSELSQEDCEYLEGAYQQKLYDESLSEIFQKTGGLNELRSY